MHSNLRSFIEQLRREKSLIEVEAEVDPNLELAEIHRRVIDAQGPALLFKRVKGSSFPVVTNLFGTRDRVDQAIGPHPEIMVQRAVAGLEKLMPPVPSALWQEKDWIWSFAKSGLRQVSARSAPILEIKDSKVDLTKLPVLTSWPEDGGPFLTLPLVYTENPNKTDHNLGMYRVQIHSPQQTGMHWQIHKGGGFHYHLAEGLGQELPVTVFLGGPPALTLAAIAPLPEMLPELLFASFLMGEKLPCTRVDDHPHALIAEAEFALCGSVPPYIRHPEGPFGDHYGYYSLTHDFPVFNVQSIYHRRNAIYPATIVGKPRQEDYFIGEYLQSLLAPLFPIVMPGVRNLWTYAETGFHALTAAIVRASYHREAMAHAFRILGEGQLTLTKFLIITDVNVDLADFGALLEAVLARFEPERDLTIIGDTAMDTLDYTGRRLNHGSKAIMLGIGEPKRTLNKTYDGEDIPGIDEVAVFCRGCLVLSGSGFSQDPELPGIILDRLQGPEFASWPLVVLVDDIKAAHNQTGFLWQTFTRFDPAHDIYAKSTVRNHKLVYQGPILIDARMKPDYPGEVIVDQATADLVDRRWREYGIRL